MAPPPHPLLLLLPWPLPMLAPAAAATGSPRAIGREAVLLLMLLLLGLWLQALKTASCLGPSHHILPGMFQSYVAPQSKSKSKINVCIGPLAAIYRSLLSLEHLLLSVPPAPNHLHRQHRCLHSCLP